VHRRPDVLRSLPRGLRVQSGRGLVHRPDVGFAQPPPIEIALLEKRLTKVAPRYNLWRE
jgi:hypothetical protein